MRDEDVVILVATMALAGVGLVVVPQLSEAIGPLGADLAEAYRHFAARLKLDVESTS